MDDDAQTAQHKGHNREGTIAKAEGPRARHRKDLDSNRGIGIIHGKNGDNYPVILADVIKLQPLTTGQLVRFSVRFVNDHAFATNVGASQSIPLEEPWMNISPADRESGCYPIEETEAGNKTISKVELLDISEAPLNPSLFDLPAGYRRALHTWHGGADLTKPDTISNRAQYCWTRLTFWVRGLFR